MTTPLVIRKKAPADPYKAKRQREQEELEADQEKRRRASIRKYEKKRKKEDKIWQAQWAFVRTRLNKLRQEFGKEFGKGGCDYFIFNSLKPE